MEDGTTVLQLRNLLVRKWSEVPCPTWALVERVPALLLERELEEDENMLQVLENWSEGSNNQILFLRRPDRHDLFRHPEKYLNLSNLNLEPGANSSGQPADLTLSIEGPLWYKLAGKKSWRKETFSLRDGRLYYFSRKKSLNSTLNLFLSLKSHDLYRGLGWRRRWMAPTLHGFALKVPENQGSEIKYFCCPTAETLEQWMTGIRISLRGGKLWKNFRNLAMEAGGEEGGCLATAAADKVAEAPKEEAVVGEAVEADAAVVGEAVVAGAAVVGETAGAGVAVVGEAAGAGVADTGYISSPQRAERNSLDSGFSSTPEVSQ